jgi:hypothetical protein
MRDHEVTAGRDGTHQRLDNTERVVVIGDQLHDSEQDHGDRTGQVQVLADPVEDLPRVPDVGFHVGGSALGACEQAAGAG